jgi:phytoene dehydrogenase-like protein
VEVLTPVEIEARYGATEGHIYHGEHALDQLLIRPTPECARYRTPIEGLYLCSSGSHPGGGLTCAPGALGARAILA